MALTISFALSILLQLGLPIALVLWIRRRYQTSWRLILVGVMAYLVFQIIQVPIFQAIGGSDFYTRQIAPLSPVFGAVLIGLISAMMEGALRTGSFFLVRNAIARWGAGLSVAAGHAGIESVMIGLQLLLNLIFALTLSNNPPGAQLSPQEAADLQAQIATFWQLPWYLPLAASLQRLAIFALQLSVGIMVWWAVARRVWAWIGAAVLWQAAMNAVTVVLAVSMPEAWTAALFVVLGLVNGGIFYFLAHKFRQAAPEEPVTTGSAARKKLKG